MEDGEEVISQFLRGKISYQYKGCNEREKYQEQHHISPSHQRRWNLTEELPYLFRTFIQSVIHNIYNL